jgi:hypothetical protein
MVFISMVELPDAGRSVDEGIGILVFLFTASP